MKEQAPIYLRCPLCGFEFPRHRAVCSRGCPLEKTCKMVCCPNCRYKFPDEPQPRTWFQRLFRRERTEKIASGFLPLVDARVGEKVEIIRVNFTAPSRRNPLAVYGVIPGGRVTLVQKRPAVIIRVGQTELALEPSIANGILVRRPAG